MPSVNPIGKSTAQASRRRAMQSSEYRAEIARLKPYEEIARQVIRLRMVEGISQEELARRVGTTKSAISRLESGHHAPTVATLNKVAMSCGRELTISFEQSNNSGSRSRRRSYA
jgi:ribosome-binding protein aMBF1 (putative translation factor)